MIGGSFRLCTLRHIVSRGRVRLWPRCLLFERKAVVEICRWKEDPVTFTHLEATFIHFLYFLTFFFFTEWSTWLGARPLFLTFSSLYSFPTFILSFLLAHLIVCSFLLFFFLPCLFFLSWLVSHVLPLVLSFSFCFSYTFFLRVSFFPFRSRNANLISVNNKNTRFLGRARGVGFYTKLNEKQIRL